MKYFIIFFLLFVSLVSADLKSQKNISSVFKISSNVWYRSQNDNFSVYSKNKRLSSHLNKLSLKIFNRITNEFLTSIPEDLDIEIYVHKNLNEISSYLKCDPVEFKLKRWKKDSTLMSYQLDDKNNFRSELLYNDIPYMITLAYLNAADPDDKIPAALKIGLAHYMEKSYTNIIKSAINQDESFWVNQTELFEFKPFEMDEEPYLNKISGTSVAWVLYLKNNCSKDALKKAFDEIINGKDISISFGEILELGKYDILPRLEEKIKKFLIDNFFPENKTLKSPDIDYKPLVSKALPALAVIILIFVVIAWIKRSIL